jgi:HEPN domain-containing protein
MSTRTRRVGKELYRNYLEKARESLEAAEESLRARRWNAATINAVHCGISATDALTVFMIGVRHVGERHEDAIALLQTLDIPRETLAAKGRQLGRLLAVKNAADYEERLIKEKEASEAVRDAERYFEWVENLLKN